jgi:hypothetical protein
VNEILAGAPDGEPDYLDILNELTPNHVLVQRAAEYEISRRREPALILAEFPDPLRRLFDELIDAHRWGLDRAAVALCRAMLEEMVDRAVDRTGVSVLPKERESWFVAALGVLLQKNILSQQQYAAADEIRRKGNDAVHETSPDVSAWRVIQITVDLLRSLADQGLLSDWERRD